MKKLVLVVLALALLIPVGSAQADSSASWKQCGEQQWLRSNYFKVEAQAYGCGQARKLMRSLRTEALKGTCDTMSVCVVEGFNCKTLRAKEKILCSRDESRVRLRKGRGWH